MLEEILEVRQNPGEDPRRWFRSADWDLYVWFEDTAQSKPRGWQLCYDRSQQEKSLSWFPGQGFRHQLVDDGDAVYANKGSAILTEDAGPIPPVLLPRFAEESATMEPSLRQWMLEKLGEYRAP